jgi:putative sterol carrier protein
VEGKLDGMGAFMSGKLKVQGDLSLAMRLQTLLG